MEEEVKFVKYGKIIYFHLLKTPMKMTYEYKEGKWGDK